MTLPYPAMTYDLRLFPFTGGVLSEQIVGVGRQVEDIEKIHEESVLLASNDAIGYRDIRQAFRQNDLLKVIHRFQDLQLLIDRKRTGSDTFTLSKVHHGHAILDDPFFTGVTVAIHGHHPTEDLVRGLSFQ